MKFSHTCLIACIAGLVICLASIGSSTLISGAAGIISGVGLLGFAAARMFE